MEIVSEGLSLVARKWEEDNAVGGVLRDSCQWKDHTRKVSGLEL